MSFGSLCLNMGAYGPGGERGVRRGLGGVGIGDEANRIAMFQRTQTQIVKTPSDRVRGLAIGPHDRRPPAHYAGCTARLVCPTHCECPKSRARWTTPSFGSPSRGYAARRETTRCLLGVSGVYVRSTAAAAAARHRCRPRRRFHILEQVRTYMPAVRGQLVPARLVSACGQGERVRRVHLRLRTWCTARVVLLYAASLTTSGPGDHPAPCAVAGRGFVRV
jgi:hypothetical protein